MKKTIILLLLLSLQIQSQCFQKTATGLYHTLAIKADGTLWAWGDNAQGQLGDGTNINRTLPVQIGNNNHWSSIYAGPINSFALKDDGTLWAWGYNYFYTFSDGTNIDRNFPVQVGTDTNWKTLAVASETTHAIKTDGTIWAVGVCSQGQTGDNCNNSSSIFLSQRIGGTDWKSVTSGNRETLAIKNDGTLWGWGQNFEGQLGNGTVTITHYSTQSGTANDWKSVDIGPYHAVGVKNDGTLWAWGKNSNGQVGDGTHLTRSLPVQIGTANNWKSVAAGSFHSQGVKTDGTLWSWGQNAYNALGDGTTTDRAVPTQIGTATNWQSVAAGWYYSVAIKTDGSLWSWGKNQYGNQANGTYNDNPTPTLVACPTSLGVDDFAATSASKLYPNPVKDVLNIVGDKDISSLSIYNLLGQALITKLINGKEAKVEVSNLSAGTYLVKIDSGDQVQALKIIKE